MWISNICDRINCWIKIFDQSKYSLDSSFTATENKTLFFCHFYSRFLKLYDRKCVYIFPNLYELTIRILVNKIFESATILFILYMLSVLKLVQGLQIRETLDAINLFPIKRECTYQIGISRICQRWIASWNRANVLRQKAGISIIC